MNSFFSSFFTISRQIVGKRSVIRNCYRKRCAPQTCSNSTFLRFPCIPVTTTWQSLAFLEQIRWHGGGIKKRGVERAHREIRSLEAPPGAVSPTKESPWENGRPSSQVTFSSHRRPSTVPLAFSFFSFFFPFPIPPPRFEGRLKNRNVAKSSRGIERRSPFPRDFIRTHSG